MPQVRYRFVVLLNGIRVSIYPKAKLAWDHAREIGGTVRREQYIEFGADRT